MIRENKKIFTLGTSNRTMEGFFSLLTVFEIKQIIDIRRFPKSSRYPHFNRKNLEISAPQHGLFYEWLGDLLGGYRKGGYEAYRLTPKYHKGLEKLENLGQKKVSALVCAELLPWKCHRLQVSQDLVARGWRVIHIIDANKTWEPSLGDGQEPLPFPTHQR